MFNSSFLSTDYGSLAVSFFLTSLPKFLLAIGVLLAGAFLAKHLRQAVIKFLQAIKMRGVIDKTPMSDFMDQTGLDQRIESVIGTLVYWAFLILVIYIAVSVAGLSPLVFLMERVFNLMPAVLSAGAVLVAGLIGAGLVESFVKTSLKHITGRSTLLVSKTASYGVLVLTVMMVLSELGIARDFILIIFMGFVATFALAVGLAIGLGSQHMIKDMLSDWYKRTKQD